MKKILLVAVSLMFSNLLLAQLPCTKLFFSEYIEGTGNNKALEIYNPAQQSIDMSKYKVFVSFNGGASVTSKVLSGSLAPGGTYIIVHYQAPDSNTLFPLSNIKQTGTWFNGNDAIALIDTVTGDTLDIIGTIGEDPGTNWPITSGGSTENYTLVRNADVHVGSTNWISGQTQWTSYPQNTYTFLGSHSMNPCPIVSTPIISMLNVKQFVSEIDGDVNVKMIIENPSANATSVTLSVLPGGTATEGADYTLPDPITVTFPGNSSDTQTVTIPIINDADIESTEFFLLKISNPTNNALIDLSTDSIIILDDDISIEPPTVFFLSASQNCPEETNSCAVQIEIFGPNNNPTSVNVNLLLAQTTATPGVDFTYTNTTVTFPASSSTSQLISVGITDDVIYEGNEAIALILANPTNNATIGTNNKNILTIVENDPNSVFPVTEGAFTIIPNPVKNQTMIAAPVYMESIRVYNTLGQLVSSVNLLNSTSYYADYSDLMSGTYIIELTTQSGQVLRHRMIKL